MGAVAVGNESAFLHVAAAAAPSISDEPGVFHRAHTGGRQAEGTGACAVEGDGNGQVEGVRRIDSEHPWPDMDVDGGHVKESAVMPSHSKAVP